MHVGMRMQADRQHACDSRLKAYEVFALPIKNHLPGS